MSEEQRDDPGMDMGFLKSTSAISAEIMKVKIIESGPSSQSTPALAKQIGGPPAKHQRRLLTLRDEHLQGGRVGRKFERPSFH